MDARALLHGRGGQPAYPAHRVELAVLGVGGRARRGVDADADALGGQAPCAGFDLPPLPVVARDLIRAVPAQGAVDAVFFDQRAHEPLRAPREAPDAQRALLSVPTRRGDEVLRDAREQESGVAAARRLGHAARLEHDDARASRREEIRGRDTRDARAHDRDVGRLVASERRIGARSPVEPQTHRRGVFHVCVTLTVLPFACSGGTLLC